MIFNFVKSVGFYTLGNAVIALSGFVLLPVMTRIIDADNLGYLYLFQAIITLSSALIAFGGQSVLQSYYHREEKQFQSYLSSSMINSLTMCLLLALTLYVFPIDIFASIGVQKEYGIFAIILSYFFFIQSMTQSIYQTMGKARQYFIMVSCSSLISVFVTIIILIYFIPTWKGRIIGIITAYAISLMFGLNLIKKIGYALPNATRMKELASIGHPVIIHSFSMMVINQTDKFLLGHLKSSSEVGIYGVESQIASIVMLFGSTLSLAYTPILYKNLTSNTKKGHKHTSLIRRLCMLGEAVFGIIFAVIVLNYYKLIIGPDFSFEGTPFVFLTISSILFSWYFLYAGYFYHFNKTKVLASISTSIAIVNIIISYYLIPEYGMSGAAIGTLISYTLGWICAFIFSKYIMHAAGTN